MVYNTKALELHFTECIKFIVGNKIFLSLFQLTQIINIHFHVALFSYHLPFITPLLV